MFGSKKFRRLSLFVVEMVFGHISSLYCPLADFDNTWTHGFKISSKLKPASKCTALDRHEVEILPELSYSSKKSDTDSTTKSGHLRDVLIIFYPAGS